MLQASPYMSAYVNPNRGSSMLEVLQQQGVIGIIGVILGALITGIFALLKTNSQADTDDRIDFRNAILKRISSLEARHARLEKDVSLWKGRYWSLYAWQIEFSNKTDIDIKPPKFHEMDGKELEQELKQQKEADETT